MPIAVNSGTFDLHPGCLVAACTVGPTLMPPLLPTNFQIALDMVNINYSTIKK